MLSKIKKFFTRDKNSELNDMQFFYNIMRMAHNISHKNPDSLFDLIRALLKPLQYEQMLSVVEQNDHMAFREICDYDFFFSGALSFWEKYHLKSEKSVKVNLTRDIVLPTPWNRERYLNAISTIGVGRRSGEWTQDHNHRISVWLPWKISFVQGGNHSITAGILAGEGEIHTTDVYDFSPIFDVIKCDGRHYINLKKQQSTELVSDIRRAAVFEIGRLIQRAQSCS